MRIAVTTGVVALAAWAGMLCGRELRADEGPADGKGGAAGKPADAKADAAKEGPLELGAFSVSLAVKDIKASRAFYEKLGFRPVPEFGGKSWAILRSGTTTIGLFQGMVERNSLTFNPGWSAEAKPLETFQDIRDLQRAFKARGLKPSPEADDASKGPASLMLVDPDGNPVLLDQHVARPKE